MKKIFIMMSALMVATPVFADESYRAVEVYFNKDNILNTVEDTLGKPGYECVINAVKDIMRKPDRDSWLVVPNGDSYIMVSEIAGPAFSVACYKDKFVMFINGEASTIPY